MQTAIYIAFGIHTVILFLFTGVAFMNSGDFKYFSKKNTLIAYLFLFLILGHYIASLIYLLGIKIK